MTDLERTVEFFRSLGMKPEVTNLTPEALDPGSHFRDFHFEITLTAKETPGVEGYDRFQASFFFGAEGQFKEVRLWE